MPTLNVRNIPEDVYQSLRETAARHGVSMESFVRDRLPAIANEPETSPWMTLEEIQREIAESRPKSERGQSMVDDLIAERRREAAKDDAEYQEWLANRDASENGEHS